MPESRPAAKANSPKAKPPKAKPAKAKSPNVKSPTEVELKLELDPADLGRLREELSRRAGRDGKRQSLDTVYYDTRRFALKEAGISLRVRRLGKRRIQTIKAASAAGAGLFERAEWERDIDGAEPDLTAAAGTALEPFVDGPKPKKLRPVFALKVERDLFRLRQDGSDVEASLDRGVVEADARVEPLSELELELKRGAPPDLFAFAKALAACLPLRLGIRTKAERGYALLEERAPGAVKAKPVALTPEMTTAAAFQAIGRGCLHHLMANEAVLRARRDPDAVHQMRVAMRRLRAAISLFGDVVADDARDSLKDELRWISGTLGKARDLDVFLAKTLAPLREHHPEAAELGELAASLEAQRDEAYGQALAAVTSPRFLALALDAAAWIEAGSWLQGGAPTEEPIGDFAVRQLSRRAKKVRRRGAGLEDLDAETRHRVRIEIKKLRYAAEFFSRLFEGKGRAKRLKAYLAGLAGLQETLGDLNDMAVSQGITAGMTGEAADRVRDLIVAAQDARGGERLKEAVAAYHDFVEADPFWR